MSCYADLDDGEVLWRRVHEDHYEDGRVTSAAFKGFDMSVDRAKIQENRAATLKQGVGVAEFTAAEARRHDQQPVAAPNPGEPAHALVRGHKPKGISRALARLARFIPRDEFVP